MSVGQLRNMSAVDCHFFWFMGYLCIHMVLLMYFLWMCCLL